MNVVSSMAVMVLLLQAAPPGAARLVEKIWSFDWRPSSRGESSREAGSFSLEVAPVEGARIRRPEGEFGSLRRGGWSYHKGVDFLAPEGSPVKAPRGGYVCYSDLNGELDQGYGYTLIIDHGNNFYTLYAHLMEMSPVRVGDWVEKGRQVGKVGHSGNACRLPKKFKNQLHFEIIHAPSGMMDFGGIQITGLLSPRRITTLRRMGEAVYGLYWGGVLDPEEFGDYR